MPSKIIRHHVPGPFQDACVAAFMTRDGMFNTRYRWHGLTYLQMQTVFFWVNATAPRGKSCPVA